VRALSASALSSRSVSSGGCGQQSPTHASPGYNIEPVITLVMRQNARFEHRTYVQLVFQLKPHLQHLSKMVAGSSAEPTLASSNTLAFFSCNESLDCTVYC